MTQRKTQYFVKDDKDVVIGTDDQDENKGWPSHKAAEKWAKKNCPDGYEIVSSDDA
jgi:hypothetical protein